MLLHSWLESPKSSNKANFTLLEITEKTSPPDEDILKWLNLEILSAYRDVWYLKYSYKNKTKEELMKYLDEYVFPNMKDQFSRNVWQWDFWEIITSLIAIYVHNLIVPIKKMRWKFNKEKSVFSTDLVSHNNWSEIEEIHYYEIKTKQNLTDKIKCRFDGTKKYITSIAYKWLEQDQNLPNWALFDFLSRQLYQEWKYDLSKVYWDLVLRDKNDITRKYEIVVIGEKSTFSTEIIDELEAQSIILPNTCLTLILIENFKDLLWVLRNKIINNSISTIYE